ncbi:MAG: lipoyl synthase [Armatimonadetes bacterium]|nr:lipoyl synthase [Armatimonadota bacterium]
MEQRNYMQKRPEWLKAKAPQGVNYEEIKALVNSLRLNTVCQSANCPNIGECWNERTATFMILGDTCARDCGFCAVKHGKPGPVDKNEPMRVAKAVSELQLKHAVITSVTRDDLSDGGAGVFAETSRLIHKALPGCSVEMLIPDFKGYDLSLKTALSGHPEILNHNIETVSRLYDQVRPQAVYWRSIELLAKAKSIKPSILSSVEGRTKSGIMVGLGETWDEIIQTLKDLREANVDILTIGQYLAPSVNHAQIAKYYTPEEFSELKRLCIDMGFGYVESGPLVRSSYKASY